ncbi:hypothetical protein GGR53DRAFT_495901 [Hypoxylon sp. FL1150]|nr:hypothetical protein GGR53DRAFT_495901 [Hypoxylon sp. FL1150]
MSASNRLTALLAMPAPLRLLLIGAPSRIRPSQKFIPSTCFRHHLSALAKYPKIAAFGVGPPEPRSAKLSEWPREELYEMFSIPSAHDYPLEDELTALFTKNPPTFLYAESDFYNLKKNTRVPEVCVLGRSNVGKSSFVNALANRHRNVLAYVSSQAGKTRAMNTYGFGPPPLPKDIAAQAAEYKGKEDIPTHAFYLVDMPGYGHASLKEWGRNITLYLTKRSALKGVIVLIDAKVGPKPTDFQLLDFLCQAEKRTAIVLTKADTTKGGLNGLRGTCKKLRNGILEIEERHGTNWPWEKEIFVTALGAGSYEIVSSTVTIGRLAVARLAGLVNDNRPEPENNKKWTGNIVSFDDLEYAPSKETPNTPQRTQTPSQSTESGEKGESPTRTNPLVPRLNYNIRRHARKLNTVFRPRARVFHSSASSRDKNLPQEPSSQPSKSPELRGILDDFIKELKIINTTGNYARAMRRKQDLRPAPPKRHNAVEEDRSSRARQLQTRLPKEAERIRDVRDKRVAITAQKAQKAQAREEVHEMMIEDRIREKGLREAMRSLSADKAADSQSSEEGIDGDGSGEPLTPDAFDEAFVTSPGLTEKKKKKKRGKKKKGKGDAAESEPLDDFEAKFANTRR